MRGGWDRWMIYDFSNSANHESSSVGGVSPSLLFGINFYFLILFVYFFGAFLAPPDLHSQTT